MNTDKKDLSCYLFPSVAKCFLALNRRRGDLRDIQQFWRCWRYLGQRVAEHGLTEWTRSGHHTGPGSQQFLGATDVDALTFFLAQKYHPAARAAAAGAIAGTRRIDHFACHRRHRAGLLVNALVASQITGIVKDYFLLNAARGQTRFNARQKFAVVLDLEPRAELPPVLPDGSHAMRADGEHFLYIALPDVLDVRLGNS